MLSLQYPRLVKSSLAVLDEKIVEKISPIVEGVKELDALCPVNSLTGSRQNVLDMLNVLLSPDRKDLLKKFVQEVATSQSMNGLSDSEMLELSTKRLSTGLPAEDALFAKQLASVADMAIPAFRKMIDSVPRAEQPHQEFAQQVEVQPE